MAKDSDALVHDPQGGLPRLLEIMRRLLDGEKLDIEGEYYKTDRAKLYSPPVGPVPIWLAAGGPKSAGLAARLADGIITSVKDPAVTFERVIDPATAAASDAGREKPPVMASRWSRGRAFGGGNPRRPRRASWSSR